MVRINPLEEMLDLLSSDEKFLKTIKEVSRSRDKPYKYVSENEKDKILSMDSLSEDVYEQLKKKYNNVAKHSSVDGLHYIKSGEQLKLIFIEFKHVNLSNEKTYAKAIEELKVKLKLKPLETLSCVFPHLIDNYSKKDKNLINSLLLKAEKHYFVVYKDISNNTKSNLHKDLNRDLISVKRLAKHPFEKVYIVDPISFEKIMNSINNPI
ncbi:MAG: hypothetical protein LBU74_04780 [Methanobacteriaceae archaeon]|jgi:hypothetical protein|nr:hypothetical protein [Candidatus Methanorudis spinitermitis]